MYKEIIVDPYAPSSVDAAIKDLKEYEKWLKEKSLELCKRLAEIGANVAEISYASGFIDDGNDDVVVSVEAYNDGYAIVANGYSVCFLEFGTGVAAGNGYDTSEVEPPVDITPASWSSTQGKGHFAKDGYWFSPEGHYYTMTVPRMGMYNAVEATKRQIEQVAKEVFGS